MLDEKGPASCDGRAPKAVSRSRQLQSDTKEPPQAQRVELRPYQTEAIQNIRAAFLGGASRIALQAPTGSGKTELFCFMVERAAARGRRVLKRRQTEDMLARMTKRERWTWAGADEQRLREVARVSGYRPGWVHFRIQELRERQKERSDD
jgi:superfamily II DNA or RNA helicase